jgi:hypothetical protein
MTTNQQNFDRAIQEVNEKVKVRLCPWCRDNEGEWLPLKTYALHSVQISESTAIPDEVPTEMFAEGSDEFGIVPAALLTVGFTCANCGFIRFHRFEEGGVSQREPPL